MFLTKYCFIVLLMATEAVSQSGGSLHRRRCMGNQSWKIIWRDLR
jgi:hypothetical protein